MFKYFKCRFMNMYLGIPCKFISKNKEEEIFIMEQYKNIFENESMVSKTDLLGNITFANKKFLKTTGYTKKEVIGKTHALIKSENTPSSVFTNLWSTIKDGKEWKSFLESKAKDGTPIYSKVKIVPIKNLNGIVVEYLSIRTDVSDIIKMKKQIEKTETEVILAMGALGENRSNETGNHVKRVAEYSYLIALESGLSINDAKVLRMVAPMHDIGKVAIPDSILNKPGKLTQEEIEIMKTHSTLGYNMFKDTELDVLKKAGVIAYQHHERWDGKGYPRGLLAEEISIEARIVTLADVIDALRSKRVYKPAWSFDKIIEYLTEESGKQFDPLLVDIIKNNINKIKDIENQFID